MAIACWCFVLDTSRFGIAARLQQELQHLAHAGALLQHSALGRCSAPARRAAWRASARIADRLEVAATTSGVGGTVPKLALHAELLAPYAVPVSELLQRALLANIEASEAVALQVCCCEVLAEITTAALRALASAARSLLLAAQSQLAALPHASSAASAPTTAAAAATEEAKQANEGEEAAEAAEQRIREYLQRDMSCAVAELEEVVGGAIGALGERWAGAARAARFEAHTVRLERGGCAMQLPLPIALLLECGCARTALASGVAMLRPLCDALCAVAQLSSANGG
eukprot:SAG11_NODE_1481_length_4833_cov_7.651669_1_plen_286_part_00